MVQLFRFSLVGVDGLPTFQVKLVKAQLSFPAAERVD